MTPPHWACDVQDLYFVTYQAHHVLVKMRIKCTIRSLFFIGLVHLWTDQRIPEPMSCRCPEPRVGLLETLPRWHVTIYIYEIYKL